MRLPTLPFMRRRGPHAAIRAGIEKDDETDRSRRISASEDDKIDLPDTKRRQAIEMSRTLYHTSPGYGAANDRWLDHVIGDGVRIEVDDPKAQQWIDDTLNQPNNRWEVTLPQRLRRLVIDGEYLCALSAPMRGKRQGQPIPSGNVTIGRLDIVGLGGLFVERWNRDRIRKLVYTNPGGDALQRDAYTFPMGGPGCKLTQRSVDGGPPNGTTDSVVVAIQLWRAATLGRRSGPLFTRILDKTAVLDEALEQLGRKIEYLNRFWMHVTYRAKNDKGLGDKSVDLAFEKKALAWGTSMEPGETLVTDESVKVNCITPDYKLVDAQAMFDVFLEWILGSHGIPKFWFASGDGTNRATAVEMGSPIQRAVANYQAYVRAVLEDFVDLLLWFGTQAGMGKWVKEDKGLWRPVERQVVMADVATRDSLRDADEVSRVVLFINECVNRRYITAAEGQAIVRATVGGKPYGQYLENEAPPILELDDRPDPFALPRADQPFEGEAPAQDPQERGKKGSENGVVRADTRKRDREPVGA